MILEMYSASYDPEIRGAKWPSPEIAQILEFNKQREEITKIKEKIIRFINGQMNKSLCESMVIGNSQFLFVVNNFFDDGSDNTGVVIEIDRSYSWKHACDDLADETQEALTHGYSIIRFYYKDILYDRFNWKHRLEKYSRISSLDKRPVLLLPNRPDKEHIRELLDRNN
jgi:hypothetical protein